MGRKKVWLVVIFMVLVIGAMVMLDLFGDNSIVEHNKQKSVSKKVYNTKDITLKIDWEIEKKFVFQVYYTTKSNDGFSGKYSVMKNVGPSDKHIEIVIPAEKIYKIRYDFGSNPENVKLKNIEITGDQYINFSNWDEYRYVNIEKHKIHKEDNSLELVSGHNDPYMYFIYPFVLYKNSDNLIKK